MSDLQDLLTQLGSALGDTQSADVGLTGSVSTGTVGSHVGILAGNDMDVLQRHADSVSDHLGVSGVTALADLGLAGLELQGAVLVDDHTDGAGLQRDGPDSGVVPESGDADTLTDGAGLVLVLIELGVVVHDLDTLVQALVEGILEQLVLGEAVNIALGHQSLTTVVDGIQAQLLTDVVGVGLNCESGLGHTVAAHCASDGTVGVDGVSVALVVVNGVQLSDGASALCNDGVAVGCVCTAVGPLLSLTSDQSAVLTDPGGQVSTDGVTNTVIDKGLFTLALVVDQTAADLSGSPSGQGLVQCVLLVTEAATDVGLDNADLTPGATQSLAGDTTDDVRNLSGGNQDNAACFHVSVNAVVFDVAVLNGGGVVPALDLDQTGLLDGLSVVALADIGVSQQVAGAGLVDLGSIGLQGLLGIQNEGQLLVLDLDGTQCLVSNDGILCDDDCDVVAVVADVLVQQLAVSDVLMMGVGGPGVTRGGESDVGNIEAGQDLDDAGHSLSGGGVDGLDEAMGDLGVQDLHDQRIAGQQVLNVLGAAGGLVIGIHADRAFAGVLVHVCILLPGGLIEYGLLFKLLRKWIKIGLPIGNYNRLRGCCQVSNLSKSNICPYFLGGKTN